MKRFRCILGIILAFIISAGIPQMAEAAEGTISVMMKDGEVVVVDFKFGKKHADYHGQVRHYMSLLASMGYSHIRGYLWYVFNNEVEEVV